MSDLRTLVDHLYESVNNRDIDAAASAFTDDVESIYPGAPPMTGTEPFKQYVGVFLTAAPDARIAGNRYLEPGDTIVVEGTFSGSHTGPLMTPMGESRPLAATSNSRSATSSRYAKAGPTTIGSTSTKPTS